MTKAIPFLQKAILLSYDPLPFGAGDFLFPRALVFFCKVPYNNR